MKCIPDIKKMQKKPKKRKRLECIMEIVLFNKGFEVFSCVINWIYWEKKELIESINQFHDNVQPFGISFFWKLFLLLFSFFVVSIRSIRIYLSLLYIFFLSKIKYISRYQSKLYLMLCYGMHSLVAQRKKNK